MIFKILANWIRKVIDGVISKFQLVFIFERYMLDLVMIANEVIDSMKRKGA